MPIDYFKNMTDEQARAELAKMGIVCQKPKVEKPPEKNPGK